jgi:cell division protein FtsB
MEMRTAFAPAISQAMRRAALPALCILLIGYFLGHAIAGPSGVLAWRDYRTEKHALQAQVAQRQETHAALDRQLQLLDPRKVDRDLADEMVRRNLNVVQPDEVIVPLDAEPATPASGR